MNINAKKTVKFAAGVCVALGAVAIGTIVASGTAVRIVAEGLKAAKDTMKQTIGEIQAEPKSEIAAAEIDTEFHVEANTTEATPADFEE